MLYAFYTSVTAGARSDRRRETCAGSQRGPPGEGVASWFPQGCMRARVELKIWGKHVSQASQCGGCQAGAASSSSANWLTVPGTNQKVNRDPAAPAASKVPCLCPGLLLLSLRTVKPPEPTPSR